MQVVNQQTCIKFMTDLIAAEEANRKLDDKHVCIKPVKSIAFIRSVALQFPLDTVY